MGFFLLRRDGDAVTLIAPTIFDSRHEALAEVSRASAEGALDADEVFVIDLDAATPVLIVTPPPPAVEPEAPETPEPVGAEEMPADDALNGDDDVMIPEAPFGLVEAPIAAAVLADAEAAPPPAPESVEPEELAKRDELEESVENKEIEAAAADEPLAAPAELPELLEAPESELTAEPVARTWPWEAVPAPMDASEVGAEPPGQTDDPGDKGEASDNEASDPSEEVVEEVESDDENSDDEPEAEEVGDEVAHEAGADELPAEVTGLLADLEELAPTPPAQDGDEPQPDDLDELEASEPHEAGEPLQMSDPAPGHEPAAEPEDPTEKADDDADPEPEPVPPKAYEAGASDITTMTCDDCIYLNTCPKKGESDPTSCGSFQWKSV